MEFARQVFEAMNLMAGQPNLEKWAQSINAIFVWGRAQDCREGQKGTVLKEAASIRKQIFFERKRTVPIYIPGYDGKNVGQGEDGYPGPEKWGGILKSLNVNSLIYKVQGGGFNTKTEFDDFLKLAISKGSHVVIAVTQQEHALRAMLGAVQSLMDVGKSREIMVIPAWPANVDWARPCYGSQGEGPYSRMDWIKQEWDRIPRYQAQGDLCTFEELIEYLKLVHT